ncbi:MAG: hypothetical protein ABI284_01490 [Nitrosospira sp.]
MTRSKNVTALDAGGIARARKTAGDWNQWLIPGLARMFLERAGEIGDG